MPKCLSVFTIDKLYTNNRNKYREIHLGILKLLILSPLPVAQEPTPTN